MKILKSSQGFSILEILIALALIAIITGIAISDNFSSSKDLDQESEKIQRALRFMSDEATLRNAVVRLHIYLDKQPQEYAIEYGPSDSFVLPPQDETESSVLSPSEEEEKNKAQKELNLSFNKIQEFQESNIEINENVRLIGIGNANSNKLQTEGEVSLYTFATGEKDQAMIFLATEEQIVALDISPFSNNVNKTSYPLDTQGNKDIIGVQNEKAKELFELWMRNQ